MPGKKPNSVVLNPTRGNRKPSPQLSAKLSAKLSPKLSPKPSAKPRARNIAQHGPQPAVPDTAPVEDSLLKNNALLHVMELHYSIVSVTDRTGRIIEVNDSFCKISGYSPEELIGKTYEIIDSGAHGKEFWADVWHNVTTGQPWRGEICYRNKQGSLYWEDSILMEVLGDHGQATRYLAISTEITAAKLAEQRMRDAMDKAVQANQAKSDFLAHMSHEIRTPMHAIIGLSYLLGKTSMDEHQSALLTKVTFASKALLAVLNNVLDFSKIEADELIIEYAVFGLRRLLKELTEVMAVQASAQGIGFEVEAPDDLPTALVGDATLLHRILINLLSNAIKFTASGAVKLSISQLPSQPGRASLCFMVEDTGIGIAPEVQAHLFTPFAQADASITRRFGGTGLGLSIVKRLVTLMGGEVMLKSTPGVGSEFKVVLEFALASGTELARIESPPPALNKDALLGVRVLAVDDSDNNREVTERILALAGAQVWLASNGQEALQFLEGQRRDVDVVLMDVQMPVLDGYDATRRIRARLELLDLPIIALTAGALISERQRAIAAGMNDFIVKPFNAETLVGSILRNVKPGTMGNHHAPVTQAPAPGSELPPQLPTPGVARRPKILIADDSEENRLLLQIYLKKSPYDVTFAEDGEAALARFRALELDLILMDVQMPIMDGLDATRAIRILERERGLAPVPIIALTSYGSQEEIENCRSAGCNAQLPRSLSRIELLQAVETYRRGQDPSPMKLGLSVEMPPGMEDLVPDYLAGRKQEVTEMIGLLQASDFARLTLLSHNLKGTGAAYGFPELTRLGRALEQSAKSAERESLKAQIAELGNFLDRVHLVARV